ncbi:hypothetical protein N7457_007359 [Penicillium paradoxum]|uniref:uncharacterized protein n=1 Tax=Penicillium paradoxum TaxID=176176 RepID=UPI0025496480|nr:uncharacterized protein N7457_007359 [Penicillium paradoxum]KAJ5779639.1 hypothetical protein N7457_007359 [Penicillium paradoxum]
MFPKFLIDYFFKSPSIAMAIIDEVPSRPLVPLQWELARQTEIFLEDGLFPQAYSLLANVLASGTISGSKIVIPQPQHLAVAATMLVHPRTTTRAESGYEKEAANSALRVLRLANSLVGPMDGKFNIAFEFKHFEMSRQGRRRLDSPTLAEPVDPDKKPLNTRYSQSSSLWTRAEDFWHAVGWAFNCSVLHPARWERWQVWLQYMCNVLEDDWKEREKIYLELKQKRKATEEILETPVPQDDDPPPRIGKGRKPKVQIDEDLWVFRESLIFGYIVSNTTPGRDRRIMRAIFANGKSSLGEFKEVFNDELRIPVPDQDSHNTKKRAGGVNLEKDEYGDYLDNSEEEFETGASTSSVSPSAKGIKGNLPRRTKRTRRGTRNAMGDASEPVKVSEAGQTPSHDDSGLSSFGGYTSLALRQQLLSILSSVSVRLPREFTPLDDLYHTFVENIRDLPLPIFQHFVTPSNLPHFLPEAHSTLCELLLYVMRESSAPSSNNDYLTQVKLEKCFLPYAGATPSVINNAKISILLEALMTLLHRSKLLYVTNSLKTAVQAGIARREKSCRDRDSVEWIYLHESGLRMQFMVDYILP